MGRTEESDMFDLRAVRAFWLGGAFCLVYLVLDVTSGPEARHQTIAPVWHPAAGLALFLVLRCGRRAILPLVAAALLAAAVTPAIPAQPAPRMPTCRPATPVNRAPRSSTPATTCAAA